MEARLVVQLEEMGSYISKEDAARLIKLCKRVDEAVDYYFSHMEQFRYEKKAEAKAVDPPVPPVPPPPIPQMELKKPNLPISKSVASSPQERDLRKAAPETSIPARQERKMGSKFSLQSELEAFGFSNEEIAYAVSRTSSVEAAVEAITNRGRIKRGVVEEKQHVEPTLSCPICFEDLPASQMITLDCCHRFCKDCFVGHCTSKISSNEVQANELTCPTIVEGKPCGTPITVFELQAHLPAEVFEKYERFALRGYCETEHLVACPSCNDWFVDIQAEDMQDERLWKCIRCQKCHHKFCAKCGNVPHKGQKDQDVTCEQYAAWLKANSKADEIFEKFMQEEKIFQCPSCGHAAERKEGCKFLYCRCKSNFCALCGVLLDKSQHYSHFQNAPGCTGPFGEVCRGVGDGVKK